MGGHVRVTQTYLHITSPIYRNRSYAEGSNQKKSNAKRAGIGRDGTARDLRPLFACTGYVRLPSPLYQMTIQLFGP